MKRRAHDCTVPLQNLVSTERNGRRHVNRPPNRDEKLQPGEKAEQLEDKKAGQAYCEDAQQATTPDTEATCDSAYDCHAGINTLRINLHTREVAAENAGQPNLLAMAR
jgi:hypothetical protein